MLRCVKLLESRDKQTCTGDDVQSLKHDVVRRWWWCRHTTAEQDVGGHRGGCNVEEREANTVSHVLHAMRARLRQVDVLALGRNEGRRDVLVLGRINEGKRFAVWSMRAARSHHTTP